MTDYEIGRQAKREGEPLQANPYWSWFRHAAWERGWLEQEREHATRKDLPYRRGSWLQLRSSALRLVKRRDRALYCALIDSRSPPHRVPMPRCAQ